MSLNATWKSTPDNDFAAKLLAKVEWDRVKPHQQEGGSVLCEKCRKIDRAQLFDPKCDLRELKDKAATCDLCELLYKELDSRRYASRNTVSLRQDGAIVGVVDGPDLLSIYVTPGNQTLHSSLKSHVNVHI